MSLPGGRGAPIEMPQRKRALDKDLKQIVRIESATYETSRGIVSLGFGILFLVAVWIFATLQVGTGGQGMFVIGAAVIGGYMALNIGANDVANNVGPAIGARALTMTGALIIAAVCEAAGAILAGGDVVATVSKGIVDPAQMPGADAFVRVMMAALLSAALWINLATIIGAPVSTTHAIVGGVMGGGIAAAGLAVVDWPVMAAIAASWVISPVLGGLIAAALLGLVNALILNQADRITAARRWVPILVALTAAVFAAYLLVKGLDGIWEAEGWTVLAIGAATFFAVHVPVHRAVARHAPFLDSSKKAVGSLFTIPLICSAGLLSFAHGANDVANAVGPLAAIVGTIAAGNVAAEVRVPIWVMLVGAAGISIGLALFGPKLIRTVSEQITKLNRIRAFCVALSAAITVIVASALGLPVSSTHIAVGGIFGVGFAREIYSNRGGHIRRGRRQLEAAEAWQSEPADAVVLSPDRLAIKLEKARKRKLVRRSHLLTIVAAWLVTVPASALLSAGLYWALRGILG
ncbi:MAG TPA: anion permease [Alphaproteobacteria bacterium]|nr:anion permease [Alphaproteobacteria bacterium]